MTLVDAAILGLIQGLTEFLPVSSSGHLVIFQNLLGLHEPGITLEVMLHLGTLFSVLWVFHKEFFGLFNFWKDSNQRHYLFLLITGLLVTAILGLLVSNYITIFFESTLIVGVMLLVTGGILKLMTILPIGTKTAKEMSYKDALWVGLLQVFAVIPGISRSGTTILAAVWRGLDRETAIRYSFMLSAPLIFGASLLEMRDMLYVGFDITLLQNYFVGGLVAFLSGIVAIKLFIKILSGQKFYYFAYYCWGLGTLVIAVSLIRIIA
jgi:undecaprenyl-diphosphatase